MAVETVLSDMLIPAFLAASAVASCVVKLVATRDNERIATIAAIPYTP
jgi:hypothetical protein